MTDIIFKEGSFQEQIKTAIAGKQNTITPMEFVADATDATDVITLFNTVKAGLIAQGLMAAS